MKTTPHYEFSQNSRFATIVAGLVSALAVAVFGGFLADRLSGKFNRSNQAAERIAAALERMAAAEERAYPPRTVLPRPSLLNTFTPPPAPKPRSYCEEVAMVTVDGRVLPYGCEWWVKEIHLPTIGGTAQ